MAPRLVRRIIPGNQRGRVRRTSTAATLWTSIPSTPPANPFASPRGKGIVDNTSGLALRRPALAETCEAAAGRPTSIRSSNAALSRGHWRSGVRSSHHQPLHVRGGGQRQQYAVVPSDCA